MPKGVLHKGTYQCRRKQLKKNDEPQPSLNQNSHWSKRATLDYILVIKNYIFKNWRKETNERCSHLWSSQEELQVKRRESFIMTIHEYKYVYINMHLQSQGWILDQWQHNLGQVYSEVSTIKYNGTSSHVNVCRTAA